MKIENWNRNTTILRQFLDTVGDCAQKTAVLMTIGIGDGCENEEMLGAYWAAVRNVGKGIEGFPSFSGRPRENLTPEMEGNLAIVAAIVESVFAEVPTETQEVLLKVIIPHGRKGGEYEDFDALVADQERKAVRVMTTAHKEKRWNMLDMDGNVPQITPTEVKSEGGNSEEE